MRGEPPDKLHQDSASFNEWYDASIDWDGRLAREIPLLIDVFGPPGKGGIIDAGCGTGRHLQALVRRGYRAVGADCDEEMLAIARKHGVAAGVDLELVHTPYATLHEKLGDGFDGIFCLANSLVAAGTGQAVAQALEQFAQCLRPGGRFLIEILNFTPMLGTNKGDAGGGPSKDDPSTNDPTDGFVLDPGRLCVTSIKIHNEAPQEDKPRPCALYPASNTEMDEWCAAVGLRIDERWGSLLREPFELERSIDLIIAGTRNRVQTAVGQSQRNVPAVTNP